VRLQKLERVVASAKGTIKHLEVLLISMPHEFSYKFTYFSVHYWIMDRTIHWEKGGRLSLFD